jgi:hypothetical protein
MSDGIDDINKKAGAGEGDSDITVVHVMRHGEVANPDGILYGRLAGYHLSELGRQMADRVAEHLASRDITYVGASPLERAQETAAPIAKAHGLDLATDERLIEADNIFQGKTFGVGDGALKQPQNWKHLVNPFRPSWGEPYVDQVVRMMRSGPPRTPRAGTRPCWSAISCRSGSCGAMSRSGGCGTTRASGSARSRP